MIKQSARTMAGSAIAAFHASLIAFEIAVAVVLVFGGIAACNAASPAQPTSTPAQAILAGRWVGALTDPAGSRPCCLGDWSTIAVNLSASGDGEMVTNDGQHFPLLSRIDDAGIRLLDLVFASSTNSCLNVTFAVTAVQVSRNGAVTGFTGSISGRCPNTLINTFAFAKG